MNPIVRDALLVLYAMSGPAVAYFGVRYIIFNKSISERKAVKHGSVPSLYYTVSKLFLSTEDNLAAIRARTISQGISMLLMAVFLVCIFFNALGNAKILGK